MRLWQSKAIRWPRGSAFVAVALAIVTAAANAWALLFLDRFAFLILLGFALGTFSGVGVVITLLRPRHAIGWLFLLAGTATTVSFALGYYSWQAVIAAPGSLPAGEVTAWFRVLLNDVGLGATIVAFFLFPTGRPQSRSWGWLLAAVVGTLGVSAVVRTLGPAAFTLQLTPAGIPDSIPNPLAAPGALGEVLTVISPLTSAASLPIFLLAGASVAMRFRGASGIERPQLKWFAYAVSVTVVLLVLGSILPSRELGTLAWAGGIVSGGLIPVAAGIAILRHRLYDIDVLINRTVVYGATTAAVGGTFFVGLVALQAVLRPITNGSDLAVAAATLVSFALFQPVRRVVQAAVDRRFDRSRYDAARTLEAFADLLRDEVDLDELRADLLGAVQLTMAPACASLWLRERTR